ncbi:MAG: bifunctional phosphoribosylaminoimidazolecarboxamide formyltransferase/IMP cyclohydrolase, partial [Bacteroidota bacterium]
VASALISVYHKQGLEELVHELKRQGVKIYSTGGSANYIRNLGAEVHEVADLTGYPSILGGRVKTLHPKVHGGILARRDEAGDQAEMDTYDIPPLDLVVVDLYPFEDTVASGAEDPEVIAQIDIGGIALIRAAAKNYRYVACVPSREYYHQVTQWLQQQNGMLTLAQRKSLAGDAFDISSHYDTQIHHYLKPEGSSLKISARHPHRLRYGENPHQSGYYYGRLDDLFEQLNGKAISYNNLVDIEGAIQLVDEFPEPCFAVIKHTNPCGCAIGDDLLEAWEKALAGDPISAFGGILACNGRIDEAIASSMKDLFFEVLIAEDYSTKALEILTQKKNRILLKRRAKGHPAQLAKRVLGGYLVQDRDQEKLSREAWAIKTSRQPTEAEKQDIIFGDTVCKHLKSNAIALVKGRQLIGSGVGQTSRIDAMKQAIAKAEHHGFDVKGSVLASDAFFPFSDSVELAYSQGIEAVVQPGGSKRDQESIDFCERQGMCMVFTGVRHFKH